MDYKKNDYKSCDLYFEFTVWLRTVLKNAKIDYIRQKNRYDNFFICFDSIPENQLIHEDEYNMSCLNIEKGIYAFDDEYFDKMFSKLTPRCRQVLLLIFVEDFDIKEIEKLFCIKKSTVSTEKSVALRKLRRLLCCKREGKLWMERNLKK